MAATPLRVYPIESPYSKSECTVLFSVFYSDYFEFRISMLFFLMMLRIYTQNVFALLWK